jgi:V-type H+-transporting ATPase subunit a
MIETIEFVLGSISNTASYLRLWALSLAHSQLAEVFFDQTVGSSMTSFPVLGIPGTIIAYVIWMGATIGVLLLMDLMECFLHALRLHWVEFQNKFYKADGYLFMPFSFKMAITENNDVQKAS